MKLLGRKRSSHKKNQCYAIEDIITRKTEDGKNYYLIKWKGYSIAECTWEPISHLNLAVDMVEEFDNNYPHSINQKLLNEFLMEYNRFNYLKNLQKLKIKKRLKTAFSNIIIIPLDDVEEKEEDHKEDETESKTNITICVNEKKTEDNCCNTNAVGKLIKPILIN